MSVGEEALRRAAEILDELTAEAGADDPAQVYAALVAVAVRRLPGVASASVTTWDGRRYVTAAATDDAAREADRLQHADQHSPCVTAIRDGARPAGPTATGEDGLAGVLSLRLTDGVTNRPAAALNLYAKRPEDLAPETVQLAVLYAGRARLALVAAEHAVRAANLERSQVTGQQIGAAVGVLMAVKRISHDEARDLLRTTSQYVNRRVSDLAAEVVATGELPPLKRIGPRRGAQPKRPEM